MSFGPFTRQYYLRLCGYYYCCRLPLPQPYNGKDSNGYEQNKTVQGTHILRERAQPTILVTVKLQSAKDQVHFAI